MTQRKALVERLTHRVPLLSLCESRVCDKCLQFKSLPPNSAQDVDSKEKRRRGEGWAHEDRRLGTTLIVGHKYL